MSILKFGIAFSSRRKNSRRKLKFDRQALVSQSAYHLSLPPNLKFDGVLAFSRCGLGRVNL
ncbi:hypothetical protein CAMRE0001_2125 [Campylobacter rectus RM3267]|uniref:Uncharacterized protein n=1 Tax=Campylobacter rectus RM3267 TaxID=553218 RepID=B9D4C9_CAMRE|nr:hypothetical protein CAMRE0001_2125 [Campylobacter rectus RM3267]